MLARTTRARLSVRVPRGAAGDVEGGVRDVVESVDDEVAAPEVRLREGFGLVDVAVE